MVGGGRRSHSFRSRLAVSSRNMSKGTNSYRENQLRFFADRSKLARSILDHVDDGLCSIETNEVERYFKSKWESKELFKGLGRFGVVEGCSNKVLAHPVTAAQVLASRKAIGSGSAAGPDGIRKACLVRWDPSGGKLARMLTGFLLSGRIPVALKTNRTTLIPKTRDRSLWKDVANWRPITIGSMVLTLFLHIA